MPGMGVNHNGMSGVNQPAASGAAAANAMALGLRGNGVGPTGVPQGRYSQEQINQIMRMKAQQLAAQQNGMPNGISINYPQHAILAAQQQAINAATSTNKHAANGNVQHDNMGNNANGVLPQPHNRQPSMMAAGHAGSPRVQQAQHSQNAQLISQWIQSSNPNLSPADVQKLTNQRLQEYHMRISAQMASATTSAGGGIPNGIPTNGLSAHQQQLYQQQQAMRHQQQLLQQRQGSQGPNISQQASLGGNVSGTVGASTPPTHPNHLQKSVSMQGQQMQKQPSQQQGQQQSPRLTQAPMTSGPPQQPQH